MIGPGVGRSESFTLRIGTPDEVRAAALQKLGEFMGQIDDVEQKQDDLANDVGKLMDGPTK
ncbi:MAG: hypothetical protein QM770_11505 [Tepidisphaeraceae bacterium]